MKCPKCGNESNFKFCPYCGTELKTEIKKDSSVIKTKQFEDCTNNIPFYKKKWFPAFIVLAFVIFILLVSWGTSSNYIANNSNNNEAIYETDDDTDYDYDSDNDYDDSDYEDDSESKIEYENVSLKKLVNNCWDDYYAYVKTTIKVTKSNPQKGEYSYVVYDYKEYNQVTVKFKNVYPKEKKINVGGFLTVQGSMSYKENNDKLTVIVNADNRTKTDKSLFKAFGSSIKIPQEYKNALEAADSYANDQNMSKARLYKQLTSKYGEKFPADAAQYAIDNVKTDWKKNALITGKSYYIDQHMSKERVYQQLVSEYGEQFTPDEAKYAVDHLDD